MRRFTTGLLAGVLPGLLHTAVEAQDGYCYPGSDPICAPVPDDCDCCEAITFEEGRWRPCAASAPVNEVRTVGLVQHGPSMFEIEWRDPDGADGSPQDEGCTVVVAMPECRFRGSAGVWSTVATVRDAIQNSALFLVPVTTDRTGRLLDSCGTTRPTATDADRYRVPTESWMFAVQERASTSCVEARTAGRDGPMTFPRPARVSIPDHGYNYQPFNNARLNRRYGHYNPVRGALLEQRRQAITAAYEPNTALMLDSMSPDLGPNEAQYFFSGDPGCRSGDRTCVDELRSAPGAGLGISVSETLANNLILDQFYDPATRDLHYRDQYVNETGEYYLNIRVDDIEINNDSVFVGASIYGAVSTARLLQRLGHEDGTVQFGSPTNPIKVGLGFELVPVANPNGVGVQIRVRLRIGGLFVLPGVTPDLTYVLPDSIPLFVRQIIADRLQRELERLQPNRETLIALRGQTLEFAGRGTVERVEAWFDPPHVSFTPTAGTLRANLDAHAIVYYSLGRCEMTATRIINGIGYSWCSRVSTTENIRSEQPIDLAVEIDYRPIIAGNVMLLRFDRLNVTSPTALPDGNPLFPGNTVVPPRALVDILENHANVNVSSLFITDQLIASNLRPVPTAWWYVSAQPMEIQMFGARACGSDAVNAGRTCTQDSECGGCRPTDYPNPFCSATCAGTAGSFAYVPVRVRQEGHPISVILEATDRSRYTSLYDSYVHNWGCTHWSNVSHQYQYSLFETDADALSNYRYRVWQLPTHKHRDFTFSLTALSNPDDPLGHWDSRAYSADPQGYFFEDCDNLTGCDNDRACDLGLDTGTNIIFSRVDADDPPVGGQ